MRLTCPKCAAQYEVNDTVIPDGGRDVQCASCATMWFQPSARMLAMPHPATDPRYDAAPGFQEAPQSEWQPGHVIRNLADADRAQDMQDDAIAAEIAKALEGNKSASDIPEKPEEADIPEDVEISEDPEIDDDTLRPAPQPGMMPRRKLDDGLLAILREEAEREAQARRAEGSLLQTQEEMNLEPVAKAAASRVQAKLALLRQTEPEEAPPAEPEAPQPEPEEEVLAAYAEPLSASEFEDEVIESVEGEDPDYHIGAVIADGEIIALAPEEEAAQEPDPLPQEEPTPPEAEPSETEPSETELVHVAAPPSVDEVNHFSRRDQLPDIEEINSTLRASSDRGRHAAAFDAPQTLARRRSGFRLGFGLVVLVAAALAALYLGAEQISAAIPALELPLETYVAEVDKARLALDNQLEQLIIWLGGAA